MVLRPEVQHLGTRIQEQFVPLIKHISATILVPIQMTNSFELNLPRVALFDIILPVVTHKKLG